MNKIEKGCHLHQLVLALLSWLYRAGKVRTTVSHCSKLQKKLQKNFIEKKNFHGSVLANLLKDRQLFGEQIECKIVKAFLSLFVKYVRKEV